MEKSKILSVVFPTEFIIRDGLPTVIIRANDGRPFRVCEVDELSVVFSELLTEYQEAVENMKTVSDGNR